MSPQKIIKQYLLEQHVMQLATVREGQPWCTSVYYILDNRKMYWASIPSRRHSLEIADDSRVAAAIVVKSAIDKRVAGIQIEGNAKQITSKQDIHPIALKYAARFNRTAQWVEDFSSGKTEHCLYVLSPNKYVLFDESNFPDDPRHEYTSI